ncbi:hypothetical protein [Bacillus sp. ISL-46]|uniref:hypothetical protein n=1 Tax=Bacillus sp. ISL-46 TaxID=2819129 RepID=UPI001BE5FE52|nr:hypothetical protein [Bacillus sp. ISL-46]MBT2722622.1 hypothetical protein [Bacillus sp. ISL-46]
MFWKKRRNCKHTSYKFEADFVADPIWCNDCGENLDIEEFPLTDELREQLMDWVSEYGKWIDLETDLLEENGLQLVENHNEKGLQLLQEMKKQLGEQYPIVFVPSEF